MMAELIMYTGSESMAFLREAARKWEQDGGAQQPADARQKLNKDRVEMARYNLRHARYVRERLARREITLASLL
eukprot:10615917-Lingulodinium_polyedra.AAC.1